MAGVFDIELHDAENVIVDDSDDDAIEVEEVKILMADSPALLWELKPAQFWAAILPALSAILNFNNEDAFSLLIHSAIPFSGLFSSNFHLNHFASQKFESQARPCK